MPVVAKEHLDEHVAVRMLADQAVAIAIGAPEEAELLHVGFVPFA